VTGIKRKDMADHRCKCPQEKVQCPFAEAGCKSTIVRRKLDDHLSSNQQQHLLLVMGAYKQMKSQLQVTEAKLTTAVQLLRQGGEADKEIIDSIVTCSYLKKSGDAVTMTMPRVSEYHRIGKTWRSAPFYFKEGYKMCLAVSVNKMEAGVCTGVLISLCVLKGEYDDQLKWPIGDNTHPACYPPPVLASESDEIPFTETAYFHIYKLQRLTQIEHVLYSEQGSSIYIENDCLTFTVTYSLYDTHESLHVAVKCRWI
jgi:hypothetical protein